MLTAEQMIDVTRMRGLYVHKQQNPDIEQILQVEDKNPELLAIVGQAMIDGEVDKIKSFIENGKIKIVVGQPVPETNSVHCLFLPPYYLFSDRKTEHK